MATIPTIEPQSFTSGETVVWKKLLPEYLPTDGWALAYTLQGPVKVSLASAADGAYHKVTIPTVTTASITAGTYWYQAVVTKGSESYVVGSGRIVVNANLSYATTPYDGRSTARKCLEAIRAVLENRASRADLDYSIAGRTIRSMAPEQLIVWYQFFQGEVAKEEAAEKLARGQASGRNILVRFNG